MGRTWTGALLGSLDVCVCIRAQWYLSEGGEGKGKEGKGGTERGMRTVLSDGGRAAEDDEGLAGVLGLAALLPGCGEGDGLGVGVVVPEAGDDGRETEGHRRGLIEGEVLRDLCTGWTIGVPVQ